MTHEEVVSKLAEYISELGIHLVEEFESYRLCSKCPAFGYCNDLHGSIITPLVCQGTIGQWAKDCLNEVDNSLGWERCELEQDDEELGGPSLLLKAGNGIILSVTNIGNKKFSVDAFGSDNFIKMIGGIRNVRLSLEEMRVPKNLWPEWVKEEIHDLAGSN